MSQALGAANGRNTTQTAQRKKWGLISYYRAVPAFRNYWVRCQMCCHDSGSFHLSHLPRVLLHAGAFQEAGKMARAALDSHPPGGPSRKFIS